ncbi:uncharacterized protein LOC135222897 [Macrobrachium nipponense]|uniref:uncharacterized protein LOC135222897 n=1 Tax=Macrobrachium nipponense TaxID=159736 RepID=UPI0030C7A6CE
MRPGYSNLGGYCFMRGVGTCSGTVIRKGCYGKCSLCIPDASKCIPRKRCTNHSGACLSKANWSSCDRELDSYFCHGSDCACCRTKICTRQDSCKNQGGYCYRMKTNVQRQHVCNGRVDPAGCGGAQCRCCIPTAGK